MKRSLGVPEDLRQALGEFIAAEGIALEVVPSGQGTVEVVRSDRAAKSDLHTLCAGGWIACATGSSMALKLRIPAKQLGKVLNHLDVKVRECELGLF